ncbi:expressed unknown protein [Seminavis robusta]|uniref:Uncharacterized protein n=1 Tax=Seminavis robusta TaxID=568900 RepID=A0A9N8H366_9STRA|nr:expressed unknown protein [Seminavis robusta]|eukprot:Sro20_g014470.1 n/a (227) ;mRNA; r:182838-183518
MEEGLDKSESLSDCSCSTVSLSISNEDASPTPVEKPVQAERVRRLPARSLSMPRGLRWNRDDAQVEKTDEQHLPKKEEKIRRPPPRTNSMPKRTLWKDKGGKARYVSNEAPPEPEVEPVGLATAATEALTDAVIAGGAAGLAVFDAVTATKRRFDRQLSQKRLNVLEDSNEQEDAVAESGGRFAQGRRGLLRRAKSLSAVRGAGRPIMPERQSSPDRCSGIATTAA